MRYEILKGTIDEHFGEYEIEGNVWYIVFRSEGGIEAFFKSEYDAKNYVMVKTGTHYIEICKHGQQTLKKTP